MDKQEQQEMMKYMKTAIDLETEVARQEVMIAECSQYWDTQKPCYHPLDIPERNIQYVKDDTNKEDTFENIFKSGWFAIGLGIVFSFGSVPFGVFCIVVGIILVIVGPVGIHSQSKQTYNQNRQLEEDYENKVKQIEEKNREKQVQSNKDLPIWQESKDNLLKHMQVPLDDTRRVLEQWYQSKDYIYPKYHTLPAMTSIYEYLLTGRCEELIGPNGAYNLYEDEMRKDTIISQLGTVLENLEQIKQNQYMLYQQVKSIKATSEEMVTELRKIKGYTIATSQLMALNTYYASLTATNTSISMGLQLLN